MKLNHYEVNIDLDNNFEVILQRPQHVEVLQLLKILMLINLVLHLEEVEKLLIDHKPTRERMSLFSICFGLGLKRLRLEIVKCQKAKFSISI
jgi:hypothetical protein